MHIKHLTFKHFDWYKVQKSLIDREINHKEKYK